MVTLEQILAELETLFVIYLSICHHSEAAVLGCRELL